MYAGVPVETFTIMLPVEPPSQPTAPDATAEATIELIGCTTVVTTFVQPSLPVTVIEYVPSDRPVITNSLVVAVPEPVSSPFDQV